MLRAPQAVMQHTSSRCSPFRTLAMLLSPAVGASTLHRAPLLRRRACRSALPAQAKASGGRHQEGPRGEHTGVVGAFAAALLAISSPLPAIAASAPPAPPTAVLCDATCVANLDKIELVTLPSGLKYRDIVVGKGPTPESGFQARSQFIRASDDLADCVSSGCGGLRCDDGGRSHLRQ
jgi:hypothetical protein